MVDDYQERNHEGEIGRSDNRWFTDTNYEAIWLSRGSN